MTNLSHLRVLASLPDARSTRDPYAALGKFVTEILGMELQMHIMRLGSAHSVVLKVNEIIIGQAGHNLVPVATQLATKDALCLLNTDPAALSELINASLAQ